jgi:alpha-galactosidase
VHVLLHRAHAEVGGSRFDAPISGISTVSVGPLDITVHDIDPTGRFEWSVANRSDQPVGVRSVALSFTLGELSPPVRMFRHGYQSWSRSGVATLGVDRDPSTTPGSIEMMQGVHHADQRRARDGELRSEWVTVLQDSSGVPTLCGFDAGHEHDGTWRLRPRADGGADLWAEAFLGDAVLAGGEQRHLHPFEVDSAGCSDAASLLDTWAQRAGRRGRARVSADYQVGWCSWYHYFHDVTEQHLRSNLALASDWPFDVFQLDDGFQAAIGDWLDTNGKFPSALDAIAAAIADAGRRPGIWIAPFIVAPDSQVAQDHPDWLARFEDGGPLWGMLNPEWGGGRDGVMYALDTTHPDVVAHLEHVARSLVEAGFSYIKLDFTFAPSFDGVWADASRTPAQRVRAGYEAIRRGAGEEAFLLGCGAPLSHVVGVVDGNRIGPDVAPSWHLRADASTLPGYADTSPATQHSWAATLARSFMHRRLWLNDPDCLMLRTSETAMTVDAVRTWAHAVAVSGGMALVSDDLALLDREARALLDEVVSIGRATDQLARSAEAPGCPDLMDHAVPEHLSAGGYELVADTTDGTSTLSVPVTD